MSKLNNKAVCILGMHRSGTSAVARAINLTGVYLGEDSMLIDPLDDNPKGFWEHRGIVRIHERILSEHKSIWHHIWPLENGWWKKDSIQEIKTDLVKLLLDEFSSKPIWGWKDPRTCLTLPLWNEISEELNFETVYLFVLRNPVDIANSLYKRNGFSISKSCLLWQLYVLSALYETTNQSRSIISYDDFLCDWKPRLIKSMKELNIPCTLNETGLYQNMEEFLDKNLRHSISDMKDLEEKTKEASLSGSICTLYDLCTKAVNEDGFINSSEFNTSIRNMYLEYSTIARNIHEEFEATLEYKDLEIKRKSEQLSKKDVHIDELKSAAENQKTVIQEKQRLIEDLVNSRSWKLTKPLRWLGEKILKI